jgi:hypothetical protein
MSRTKGDNTMQVVRIGLDSAKSSFQVHGVDAHGKVVVRKQISRSKVLPYFAQLPPCLIGLEACGGTHYWARELQKLGHDVRLMAVAMIQPYRTNQKNDQNDAEAILLGCAGFAQFATELEGDLHIPVLDGVVCAVKIAEAIVGPQASTRPTVSRRGKRFRACSRSSDGSTENTNVMWGENHIGDYW